MQSLQPNENASRDLWIIFLEGVSKGILGTNEMRRGGGYLRQAKEVKAWGCGVIKGKLSD
jgi:hypothetical protein